MFPLPDPVFVTVSDELRKMLFVSFGQHRYVSQYKVVEVHDHEVI